jgi:hypothetical protein
MKTDICYKIKIHHTETKSHHKLSQLQIRQPVLIDELQLFLIHEGNQSMKLKECEYAV